MPLPQIHSQPILGLGERQENGHDGAAWGSNLYRFAQRIVDWSPHGESTISMRNMVGLTAVSGDSKQAAGWFVWTTAGWRR